MTTKASEAEYRWLSGGFLLILCSGFGQTYFIGIFAEYVKADLGLTDGEFGFAYTLATLGSAGLLLWAGRLADVFPVGRLGMAMIFGLAAASLGMASVASAAMLTIVLLGLRFFGQGMLTHVAMTGIARWFSRRRGRAVAIAGLGFPAGEALLPIAAVSMTSLLGWREAWTAAAFALIVLPVPMLLVLLRRERRPSAEADAGAAETAAEQGARPRQWSRRDVVGSPLFYALLAAALAHPFILTGIFIHQAAIVDMKDWSLAWFAGSFPVLAVVHVGAALAAGWLIDRVGAYRLLPVFLVPLAAATLALTFAASPYVLPVFMALVGLTHGSASTLQGALWPELYGTLHLGAIRSVTTAGVVFASALSPGLTGVLLDAGIPLDKQILAMGGYCIGVSLLMYALMPRIRVLAAA